MVCTGGIFNQIKINIKISKQPFSVSLAPTSWLIQYITILIIITIIIIHPGLKNLHQKWWKMV